MEDGKSNPMSSRHEAERKEKASAGIYSYDDLADTDNNDFEEKAFTPFGQMKEKKECSFKESRPSFSVNRDQHLVAPKQSFQIKKKKTRIISRKEDEYQDYSMSRHK